MCSSVLQGVFCIQSYKKVSSIATHGVESRFLRNVLQCVAVLVGYCSVLRCDAVCCSGLHGVAVCCSVLQCVPCITKALNFKASSPPSCRSVLQCVVVCCSVSRCVAVFYSMSQCVTACCSVLQRVAARTLHHKVAQFQRRLKPSRHNHHLAPSPRALSSIRLVHKYVNILFIIYKSMTDI